MWESRTAREGGEMVAIASQDTLVVRAYTITALAGGGEGIDRYVLEGLLGQGSGPLVEWMISRRHLVEVEDGRKLLAARPPRLDPGRKSADSSVARGA